MQIKIEIDVKPEELRRFLGLPDVAGLQEELVQFLREKVGAASDNFDPASFVRDNFQTLRNSSAWRKIVAATKTKADAPAPSRKPTRKRNGAGSAKPRAKPRKKPAAAADDSAA